MEFLKREWGAVTFVATVLVGAVAVAISLIVAGAHAPATPPLANCPSYTPYVATAAPSASSTPSPTPSPTPFNPALANCPTPPLPPTSTPGPTPSASASGSPAATPTAASTPTPAATPVP